MTDSALRHTTHALVEMALHYRPLGVPAKRARK